MLEVRQIERKDIQSGVCLLRDISVSVRCGDQIAVVGPSGSGKTLLLRVLAMLDPTDCGEFLWMGKPVERDEVPYFRSRVIYCQQMPFLLEGTVQQNFMFPFQFSVHRNKHYEKDRVGHFIEALQLDTSFLQKKEADLSGGESQLVSLIRAMQVDPNILLLDEPTSAMDSKLAQAMEKLLCDWCTEKEKERAFVWVSHNNSQAKRVSNKMIELSKGEIQSLGEV